MNRIKDYACFAACFAGLGYIVLGPLSAVEPSAPLSCGVGAGWLGFGCHPVHVQLPPGLHVLGFTSAVFVVARAMIGTVKRSRHGSSSAAVSESVDETPPSPRKPQQPLRTVKPRTHFGLRAEPPPPAPPRSSVMLRDVP